MGALPNSFTFGNKDQKEDLPAAAQTDGIERADDTYKNSTINDVDPPLDNQEAGEDVMAEAGLLDVAKIQTRDGFDTLQETLNETTNKDAT